MIEELKGRVAVVLGARGAIGSAIVDHMVKAGASVVAVDRDPVPDDTRVQIEHLTVDVTQESQMEALFGAAKSRYSRIDIVVCSQGIAAGGPVTGQSAADWDRAYAVLVRSYFLAGRESLRVMSQGGSVVFISSKNALMASAEGAAYNSAKAAELHLARCLAEEGGAAGIRFNCVNPDAVLGNSRIFASGWAEARARTHGVAPDQLATYYRQRNAMKVEITAADVAEAVLFFASPRSAKCTGNILNVDGGIVGAYTR